MNSRFRYSHENHSYVSFYKLQLVNNFFTSLAIFEGNGTRKNEMINSRSRGKH